MSSSRNNPELKKMTSISRKINWFLVRKKLSKYICYDILIFMIMITCWVLTVQGLGLIDSFDVTSRDALINSLELLSINMMSSANAGIVLSFFEIVMIFIVSMQGLSLIFDYPIEGRKIKRILRPINEIALKADELSKMTFTEDDKYRILEDAISNVSTSDETISFNNKELQGVEAAMNNLLIRMRESYRQQARFVNDASHELRTPIAVIEGYANMLSRWGKEDEKVLDESITAIQHESAHMKRLVEQLLFLARGDSGKTVLQLEDISLNAMMKEIYEESLMIDENHSYKYAAKTEDIIVSADQGLLKQALRILIDNAAKYTEKGEEINLSVGYDDNSRPYVQVQDSGIGMEQKDIEHMFERFYRAEEARNTEGTGLGLSIAKWIVDKHKGHFEILSRAEIGTRIRIVL